MPRFDPSTLQADILEYAGYKIYRRGEQYYDEGRVGKLEVKKSGTEIEVHADVRGTLVYETSLVIDALTSGLSGYSCSCPYGDEDVCKHIVALAWAYVGEYETPDADPLADLRARLAVAGIDATHIPDDLIKQLAAATAQIPLIKPPEIVKWKNNRGVWTQTDVSFQKKPKPPKPVAPFEQRYHLSVDASHNTIYNTRIVKSLSRHDWYAQPVVLKDLIKQEQNLTPTQTELLSLLHSQEQSSQKDYKKELDLTNVFALVQRAGIAIRDHGTYGNNYELAWREPERINATLTTNTRESLWGDHEYDVITLTVSKDQLHKVSGVAAGKSGLLLLHKTFVELISMPELLAHILERAYNPPQYDALGRYVHESENMMGHTDLLDGEYENINAIIAACKTYLDCDIQIKPEYSIAHHTPKPVIIVDYSMQEKTLEILPSVDYGGTVLSVHDTMYLSVKKYQPKTATRRYDNAFGTITVARVDGATVHIAPVDTEMERRLYGLAQVHDGEKLGLKSSGRAGARGEQAISYFAENNLPHLKALGYEMRYVHDTLDITPTAFRAAFDINFNAENDWLAFDMELYCGDDRVQLVDIEAFIENGDTLLKMKDGRVLHITNREAIVRLIELLAHFRKNDGGTYEGRTYHAPELDAMTQGSPHYSARVSEGFRSFIDEARTGKLVRAVRIPKPFSSVLRDYQAQGVHWLTCLHRYKFAGILADDMGLGKTIQALTALSLHAKKGVPSLVVAPKTLLYNWQEEAARFAPHLKTLIVDGHHTERNQHIKNIKKYDLVITSYPVLQKDIETYEKRGTHFNYCVLDEAQYIKNPRTKNAHAVRRVKCDHRLALTGTPLENSVEEIWSAFDFLMPGFLGHNAHFQKNFGNPIMKHADAHKLERLKTKVTPFMLRRSKEEVLTELPPKVEQVITCDLSDEQNVLYQDVLKRVRSDITAQVKKEGFAASQIHILAGLTRLRQICNHPALVLPAKKRGVYPSAKLDACMEIVEQVREEKRKVLVFSQFTGMLDILERELHARKIPSAYLSGKTRKRKEVIETFANDSEKTVFLISTKAGGVGLNLVMADCVVIFDPWWNPSVEQQAIGRAHRIGQTRAVHVYRLRTKGTIEEKIAALQERKQKLFNALVGESKDLFKKLTWEDVKGLLD